MDEKMSSDETTRLMLSRAVASSKRHGINLTPGKMNPGLGNCAFEAVLYNINERACFEEKYESSADYYRRIWMTDMETKLLDHPDWNCGYSEKEIKIGFSEVKVSGVYERGLFGDLILPGIAVGVRKMILIFNTHPDSPHDPISVIHPQSFGGRIDTTVPIVLAYNLVHFESMHPVSDEDVSATINLAQSYLDGTYEFSHADIPSLIHVELPVEEKDTCSIQSDDNSIVDENTFQFISLGEKIIISMDGDGFMQCPICGKKFQRLRPHLKNKKECSAFIDFEAFNSSFEAFDKDMKKAKGREKVAAYRKRKNEEQSQEEANRLKKMDAERKRESWQNLSKEKRKEINTKHAEGKAKDAKRKREARQNQSEDKRNEMNKKHAEYKKATKSKLDENQINKDKANEAKRKREVRSDNKENPTSLGVARRFTIDQAYFHDIIESCEGPLKVWSKGEKLQHDPFWQKIVAGRFAKRLSEAFKADSIDGSPGDYLNYVLNPETKGYDVNEWTEFVKQMKKIPQKYWIDEMYTLIFKPELVAKSKESQSEQFSKNLLSITAEERSQRNKSYERPIFNSGPVCSCYARKYFLEISYLGCCSTNFKKFQENDCDQKTHEENVNDQDSTDDDVDSIMKDAQISFPTEIDKVLEKAKTIKEEKQKKRINILESKVPHELMSLYQGSGQDGKFFIAHANSLNQALAFCSLGADFQRWDGSKFVSEKEAKKRGYNPVVTVQGKMFHRIGPIQAESKNEPKFGQIYFIDADLSSKADERIKHIKTFNVSDDQNVRHTEEGKKILVTLQSYLEENYPYIDAFKMCIEIMKDEDIEQSYSVVLKADKKITAEKKIHERNSNLPLCSEVAILVPIGQRVNNLDIRLFSKSGEIRRIPLQNCHYDTLMYPLLHLHGEPGWNHSMTNLTPLKHYKYTMQLREKAWQDSNPPENRQNIFNSKLQCGKLSQVYALDIDNKIQTINLQYIKSPAAQKKFHTNTYQGLVDELSGKDTDEKTGTVYLPSSVRGSPRYYDKCYQETLAIGAEYGTPDIFLTFTANPNWIEITEFSENKETKEQRADIVARVFRLKTKRLMDIINKEGVFGKTKAYSCSEEEQKRALPHIHLLIWLKAEDKILTPECANHLFAAEFPDIAVDPGLFEVVRKNMVHGPCGKINPNSPCMENGKCTKHFPKEKLEHTVFTEKGGTLFRRRNDNKFAQLKSYKASNCWVVPYNPFMLLKFKGHINMEMVRSMFDNIKYLYKYIYKGSDVALMRLKMSETGDEVETYECLKYVNATRAFYNIYSFPIQEKFPAVLTLPVHEENKQTAVFCPGLETKRAERPPVSPLMAYFDECQKPDSKASEIRYCEMPYHYTWKGSKTDGQWVPRKRGHGNQIGRVPYRMLSPHNHEYFYMRTLLNVRVGVTGFEDLRTVPDQEAEGGKIVCNNFKEACQKLGLYHDDTEWDKVMEEASIWGFPNSLRLLATNILLYNRPVNPESFIQNHEKILTEDYIRKNSDATETECHDWLLSELKQMLEASSSSLKHVGLPEPEKIKRLSRALAHEYKWDLEAMRKEQADTTKCLTNEQRFIFESVIQSFESSDGQLFFIDAPGGSGKSFTANCIMNHVRISNSLVLACASSGIAATVLKGGSTAHNKFQLPIDLNEDTVCDIRPGTDRYKLIVDTKMVVWDEAPMMHRFAVDAVDRLFQRVKDNTRSFGGVIVVFMGDWRQTLPVLPLSSREQKIAATLLFAECWKNVKVLRLTENLRIRKHGGSSSWSDYLLSVGEGKLETHIINGNEYTKLPSSMIIESGKISDLVQAVYPSLKSNFTNMLWLYNRAIICPKNNDVQEINKTMLNLLPGEVHKFYSIDQVNDNDMRATTEVINKLTPQGMPLHEISLKVGAIIMLLRNLNPAEGHCNGTRYVVTNIARHVIEAVIPDGLHKGKVLFIPRIFNTPPKNFTPHMTRIQFPIKLAFAITSNKSQGQSLESIGIYLNAGM